MNSGPAVGGSGPAAVRYGRETCGELDTAERLEWLVTNGLGGFASGTVSGIRTRRYHGLLIAALDPPAGRTVMATDIHESLTGPWGRAPLHAARWRDGVVTPRGFEALEAFWLEGRTPVWRFVFGDTAVEKRVVMVPGQNTTIVRYRLARGRHPVRIDVKVMGSFRDFHSTVTAGDWRMAVAEHGREILVMPFDGARSLRVSSDRMSLTRAHVWHPGFLLAREQDRGLDYLDDALHVATATVDLEPGDEVELALSAEPADVSASDAVAAVHRHDRVVVEAFDRQQGETADDVGARLALAADQFLVRRDVAGQPGASVIAGYPWFGDWGRDTMIALPGLTLATGRPDLARVILTTYATFIDRGMLLNRFPDVGHLPEYNTADATLWYVEAVRAYLETTGDLGLAERLWPVLANIVAHHEGGTRHGIEVDMRDGLLRAGESGVQLTWMDARVADWVVTPRQGKCVEINALWFNALVAMGDVAERLRGDRRTWDERAARVRANFDRFWSDADGYLFDVIDGPDGDDRALRPNQILAVSLPASPIGAARQRAVVDVCARALVTSHGLHSLAPAHAAYRARYGGDQEARDGSYRQGTVWAWLLGPFALAHFRVYGDARVAQSYLEPLVDHLRAAGVGSISEIFDGGPPHHADGCIAQAWSVAEVRRAWTALRQAGAPAPVS